MNERSAKGSSEKRGKRTYPLGVERRGRAGQTGEVQHGEGMLRVREREMCGGMKEKKREQKSQSVGGVSLLFKGQNGSKNSAEEMLTRNHSHIETSHRSKKEI